VFRFKKLCCECSMNPTNKNLSEEKMVTFVLEDVAISNCELCELALEFCHEAVLKGVSEKPSSFPLVHPEVHEVIVPRS
jgi:hypothetical protein